MKRGRALASFKAKDSLVKVIMLSLENAASGSHLIEATHIILLGTIPPLFLQSTLHLSPTSPFPVHMTPQHHSRVFADPVSGTKEAAHATESQAIGRAYRQGQTKQVSFLLLLSPIHPLSYR